MLSEFSPELLWYVVVAGIVAFFLAFGVGANDVANSFGTSVGAGVLTIRRAFILATIFEIAGACLIGYSVSSTVRKDIANIEEYNNYEKELILGFTAALFGSAIWNLLATWFKMPISGTHSIIGAICGFTIVSRGWHSVNWMSIAKIVASWFISPILSGIVSSSIFLGIKKFILQSSSPLEPSLRSLPVFYGATIFVNIFSVILGGPSLLMLDKFSWWQALLISLSITITVMLVVWFWLVPKKREELKEHSLFKEGDNKSSKPSEPVILTAVKSEKGGTSNGTPATALEMVHVNGSTAKANGQGPAAEPVEVKKNKQDPYVVQHLFSFLQILTACFASFAHGGNDVSNAIGPMIAIYSIYEKGQVTQSAESPIWILAYGGIGMSIGLWCLGRRVIETIGHDITNLTASSGFSVEIGAAMTVLLASKIGLPISTTHCKVGSVFMIGLFRSRSQTSARVFGNIAAAWLLTVPITAVCSAAVMALLRLWFDITPSYSV